MFFPKSDTEGSRRQSLLGSGKKGTAVLLWNKLGTLASGSEVCGYIHHLQAIYNLKGEISVFICEYEMSTQHQWLWRRIQSSCDQKTAGNTELQLPGKLSEKLK